MIPLFDYIKLVFSKNEKNWSEVKDIEKSRNFFMLNRFMSIQYPYQAGYLSHYKIDSVSVSNYWHKTLSSKFTSTPNWIYAKTIKKADAEKKQKTELSQEYIVWYCNKNELSRKDFDQHVKFFGESFLLEMKSLEKILKSQNII